MSDSLSVQFTVDVDGAVRSLRDVTNNLKQAAEAAKQKEAKLEGLKASAKSAGDTLKFLAEKALDVVNTLREGAAAAEAHERALRLLGSASQLNARGFIAQADAFAAVTRQTNGAFSATEALRTQQTLVQSGMRVTSDELGIITRAAREYALATGTEASQAVEQLTDALVGGEADGLRRFGVSLREGQTRTEAFRSALTQLEQTQRGLAPSAQTMAETNAALSRSWAELSNTLTSNVAKWLNLQEVLQGVVRALNDVQQAQGDISAVFGDNTRADRDRAAQQADERRTEAIRSGYIATRARAARRLGAVEETFGSANVLNEAQMLAQIRQLDSATNIAEYMAAAADSRGLESDNRAARGRVAAAREQRLAGEAAAARRDEQARIQRERAQSASPAQYDATRFELADAINAFFDRLQASGMGTPTRGRATYGSSLAELADLQSAQSGLLSGFGVRTAGRRPGEDLATYLQRSLAANDTGLSALAERREGKENARYEMGVAAAANERELVLTRRAMQLGNVETDEGLRRKADETRTRNEELARRGDVGAQFRDAFLPAAEETKTAAERMAEGVSGAFNTMTGSLRTHIAALVTGKENIVAALKGIAHETMLSLAQEAAVRSAMSLAGGIAAAVTPGGQGTAVGLFAAAGVYAGVAALAGVGAYATRPSEAAASAGGGASAQRLGAPASAAAANGGRAGGPSSVTINVNGAVIDREGFESAVVSGLRGARQRGLLAA
jgi:hypothetical protein